MLFHKLRMRGHDSLRSSLAGVRRSGRGSASEGQPAPGQVLEAVGKIAAKNDSPDVLQFAGVTDLVPEMTVRVHTPFDCRVDKVLVDLGQPVKKGDPLLELFSADLAEAKSNYETAAGQWDRDKKMLATTRLGETQNRAPGKVIECVNSEAQSRLKIKLARDKLLVYGLTEQEIENVRVEDGVQKAKMTLRSRGEGVVVLRNVVQGNYYTSDDLLMTIARFDHLWVRGNVSELDAEKVKVGQELTVSFPFGDRRIKARVEFIDTQVDHETHTVKIRTTIPNPDHKLKPGMFVRMAVETGATQERLDDPRHAHATMRLDATTTDRLEKLEAKVDRLLGEKEERLSHAKILERLEALDASWIGFWTGGGEGARKEASARHANRPRDTSSTREARRRTRQQTRLFS